MNNIIMKNNTYKCFSLVEVMTAIALIVIGLLAAVTLLVSGLRDSMGSRDQITAGLLAQEGVELARNIRDNSWFSGSGKSFQNFPNNDETDCIVDIDDSGMNVSNSDCNKPFARENLYLLNGQYRSYDFRGTGSATKFSRKIDFLYDVNPSNSAEVATITSMVVWGNSFPTVTNCTTANKCVYTQIELTRWGE